MGGLTPVVAARLGERHRGAHWEFVQSHHDNGHLYGPRP